MGESLPELLTIGETAALLRTTPAALHTGRYRGVAPANLSFRVGARLLWRREDLVRWLDEQAPAEASDRDDKVSR